LRKKPVTRSFSTLTNQRKLMIHNFLKKLDSDIWEFRTKYKNLHHRLLAFWDKRNKIKTLVICTHGFIKKTDKVPKHEIEKARKLMKQYFETY
jgi:phage-related protein